MDIYKTKKVEMLGLEETRTCYDCGVREAEFRVDGAAGGMHKTRFVCAEHVDGWRAVLRGFQVRKLI
jgi:hypothetical protein